MTKYFLMIPKIDWCPAFSKAPRTWFEIECLNKVTPENINIYRRIAVLRYLLWLYEIKTNIYFYNKIYILFLTLVNMENVAIHSKRLYNGLYTDRYAF